MLSACFQFVLGLLLVFCWFGIAKLLIYCHFVCNLDSYVAACPTLLRMFRACGGWGTRGTCGTCGAVIVEVVDLSELFKLVELVNVVEVEKI